MDSYRPHPAAPSAGQATAAMIVAIVFGLFLLAMIANFVATFFRVYFILAIGCAFRCVGYALRSSYLRHFRDAEEGAYIAFTAAGFGVNIVAMCVLLHVWVNTSTGGLETLLRRVVHRTSVLLIPPVIIFGPICGIIAAGLLYGDFTASGQRHGQALRRTATWGLCAVMMAFTLLVVVTIARLVCELEAERKANLRQHGEAFISRDHADLWILVLVPIVVFMDLRAGFGVAQLYNMRYIEQDWLYSADVLPELVVLMICSWPYLIAKIGLSRKWAARQRERQQRGPAVQLAEAQQGNSLSSPGASKSADPSSGPPV